MGAWVGLCGKGEKKPVRNDHGEDCCGLKEVRDETVEDGAGTADGNVVCAQGNRSCNRWDDGEEKPGFLVRKDGV